MNDKFENQLWVKLCKLYYNETKFEDKKLPPEVKVCMMMEVESFAEWLSNNEALVLPITFETNGDAKND